MAWWAVNDGKSGSAGLSKRLEAIEIRLVEKAVQHLEVPIMLI